jgi:HEPN domain-containing protein
MVTTFPHLSKTQYTKVVDLTKRIIEAVRPDKIICYGYRSNISHEWSVFYTGDEYQHINYGTTYDLLVIPNDEEKREDHELIQIIEQQAEALGYHVTVIIQNKTMVYQGLEQGYRFASTVFAKGIMLHKNDGGILTPTAQLPDVARAIKEAKVHWLQEFSTAQRFFKSAGNCLSDSWPEQAMFNLHQTMQHTCMALLRCFTGYRSTTHNLARLLAYIENFTCIVGVIFPCLTDEETELFNLLNKAYSDARYKEGYKVPMDTARIIEKRVQELIVIAEKLYKERLLMLEAEKGISFPINSDDETDAS